MHVKTADNSLIIKFILTRVLEIIQNISIITLYEIPTIKPYTIPFFCFFLKIKKDRMKTKRILRTKFMILYN